VAKYLDTSGQKNLAIFICPRCRMKRMYVDMVEDPNTKLKVCRFGCADQLDPYRLPPRQTENISIQYPRPDEDISNPDEPYNPTRGE